jgi:hypothetical protein
MSLCWARAASGDTGTAADRLGGEGGGPGGPSTSAAAALGRLGSFPDNFVAESMRCSPTAGNTHGARTGSTGQARVTLIIPTHSPRRWITLVRSMHLVPVTSHAARQSVCMPR